MYSYARYANLNDIEMKGVMADAWRQKEAEPSDEISAVHSQLLHSETLLQSPQARRTAPMP